MKLSFVPEKLKKLKTDEIRKLCKLRNIVNLSKLKKAELIELLIRHQTALFLQRNFRKRKKKNDICPFTLDAVEWPFWSKKTNNGFFYYNLLELSEFLVASGDFRDPLTRQTYTPKELDSIESMTKFYKIKLKKSLKFARSNKKYYRNIKDKTEQIDILMERIRYIFCVIRDKLDEIITGEETVNNLLLHIDNIYMPDALNCMKILSTKCKPSLKITFEDVKRLINDISLDCNVINKIKNHLHNWVISQETEFLE